MLLIAYMQKMDTVVSNEGHVPLLQDSDDDDDIDETLKVHHKTTSASAL